MKESCCQFGRFQQLVGIVTEPDAPAPRAALVLVSAGVTPKFALFGLYVQLARRLALDGFLTLRFDLGDIGDSRREHSGLPYKKRSELEIRAAIDYLAGRYGLGGVIVLGGLCSGAEDAFRYAELDPRVGGVVLIDSFGYRTPGWMWRHVLHEAPRTGLTWAYHAARWAGRQLRESPADSFRQTSRKLRWFLRWCAGGSASERPRLVDYKFMGHAESSRILKALVERKLFMHFVYTRWIHQHFNHASQFQAMFADIDLRELATVDHFPGMRHVQPLVEDRHQVIEAIARRLAASCPPVSR